MRFPEIGEIFAENYRIEKMLGSGGFSRVYKATQIDLERAVAVKILQPPIQSTQDERERDEKLQGLINRFEREARMVSKLKSPHTITMYAYGQDSQGQLFMSIEYVDGRTLSELVREQGALEPDRVAKIMRQVLISLYEAHELGMLHRDIKPQNIMAYEHLGQRDQVKLLDFGIVKLIGTESTRDQIDLTSDDTLVGTPRYMAPEYIRGEELTASSDLYSLGLVMYELLVGERAIQADSSIQIIGKQLERESFYLPQFLPSIDIALRRIIDGMLEKNTAIRYDSALKVIEDLEAREADRHTAPPHAPPLAHYPEHTARLPDSVAQRRPPPAAASEPPRPAPTIAIAAPRLDDFEPLPVSSRPLRTRLLVGAVLILTLAFGAGTLMLLNAEAKPHKRPPAAPVHAEISSEPQPLSSSNDRSAPPPLQAPTAATVTAIALDDAASQDPPSSEGSDQGKTQHSKGDLPSPPPAVVVETKEARKPATQGGRGGARKPKGSRAHKPDRSQEREAPAVDRPEPVQSDAPAPSITFDEKKNKTAEKKEPEGYKLIVAE